VDEIDYELLSANLYNDLPDCSTNGVLSLVYVSNECLKKEV